MKAQILKKVFLSVMAIVLVMGTIVMTNVYAEESYTITINKKDDGVNHEYEAYQIFSGDLYEEEREGRKKTLSNIEWGEGISNGEELLKELQKQDTIEGIFKDCKSPREVAVVLEGLIEDDEKLKAFAKIINEYLNKSNVKALSASGDDYQVKVDQPGYYLIKDKDESLKETDYATYTRYILEVVGNIEIDPKSEKPTMEKSLSAESTTDDTGDYAINQEFMYYLTADLPASNEYGEYEKYKLIFEDQMSIGISYDGIESVVVKAKNKSSDTIAEIELEKNTEGYSEKIEGTEGESEQKLTITIDDLKKILEDKGADITKGVKVVVTYKAHLNEKANISKLKPDTDVNKPNINTAKLKYSNNPNVTGEGSMGTTIEDKNYVFTYEIDNIKYGRNANQSESDNTPLEGAGFTLYKGETPKEGEEIKLKWDEQLMAYYPCKDDDSEGNIVIKSKENGKFNIAGLAAGIYTLVEVETPKGYNTCKDVTIKIEPEFGASESSKTVTFSSDSNMENSIVNIHGSRLPSTGSITLIVIFGVAIVLGVTGLIISKNKKEE